MADKITDVFTEGAGPFATPLLARLKSLDTCADLQFVVAQFLLEDGAIVHAPIAIRAVEELNAALAVFLAERGPKGGASH